MKSSNAAGFTLIELMITVSIVGLLAGIAIPQFANLVQKSQDSVAKANLGTVRSALSIYYGDNEGQYPMDDLSSLTTGGRYLQSIPNVKAAVHSASKTVTPTGSGDGDGWVYGNNPTFNSNEPYTILTMGNCEPLAGQTCTPPPPTATIVPAFGQVNISCTHTDVSGNYWYSY